MASAQLSQVEDLRNTISKDGFYFSHDPVLGQRLEKMEADGTPFASVDGLRFCKINVLDNPRIRPVLDSFFKWFGLGLYRSFGARAGDYTFKKSDPESEVDCLLVHLWSKGSKVTFWGGSHRYLLPSREGENNLWRVPRASLKALGLEPTEVTFKQGGFTIRDPRTAVEIAEGAATTFAFGTKAVVSTWSPMKIPKSQGIEQIVALMESANFGINITYFGGKEVT